MTDFDFRVNKSFKTTDSGVVLLTGCSLHWSSFSHWQSMRLSVILYCCQDFMDTVDLGSLHPHVPLFPTGHGLKGEKEWITRVLSVLLKDYHRLSVKWHSQCVLFVLLLWRTDRSFSALAFLRSASEMRYMWFLLWGTVLRDNVQSTAHYKINQMK